MEFPSTQLLPDELSENDLVDNVKRRQIAILIVQESTQLGLSHNEYPIYEGDNIIGRHDNCDISIPLAVAMSKKHSCIEAESSASYIYDCGSSNKTKLGSLRLKPQVRYCLQDGDSITFANVQCLFKQVSDQSQPSTPRISSSHLIAVDTPDTDARCYPEDNLNESFSKIIPDSQGCKSDVSVCAAVSHGLEKQTTTESTSSEYEFNRSRQVDDQTLNASPNTSLEAIVAYPSLSISPSRILSDSDETDVEDEVLTFNTQTSVKAVAETPRNSLSGNSVSIMAENSNPLLKKTRLTNHLLVLAASPSSSSRADAVAVSDSDDDCSLLPCAVSQAAVSNAPLNADVQFVSTVSNDVIPDCDATLSESDSFIGLKSSSGQSASSCAEDRDVAAKSPLKANVSERSIEASYATVTSDVGTCSNRSDYANPRRASPDRPTSPRPGDDVKRRESVRNLTETEVNCEQGASDGDCLEGSQVKKVEVSIADDKVAVDDVGEEATPVAETKDGLLIPELAEDNQTSNDALLDDKALQTERGLMIAESSRNNRDLLEKEEIIEDESEANEVKVKESTSSDEININPDPTLLIYDLVLPDSYISESESDDDIFRKSPGSDVETGAYTFAETQPFKDVPVETPSTKPPASSLSVIAEELNSPSSPTHNVACKPNPSTYADNSLSDVSTPNACASALSYRPKRKRRSQNSRFNSSIYELSNKRKSSVSSLNPNEPTPSRVRKSNRKFENNKQPASSMTPESHETSFNELPNHLSCVEELENYNQPSFVKEPDRLNQPSTVKETERNHEPSIAEKPGSTDQLFSVEEPQSNKQPTTVQKPINIEEPFTVEEVKESKSNNQPSTAATDSNSTSVNVSNANCKNNLKSKTDVEESNAIETIPDPKLSIYNRALPDSYISESESDEDIFRKSPGSDVESGTYTSAETQPLFDDPQTTQFSKTATPSLSVITEEPCSIPWIADNTDENDSNPSTTLNNRLSKNSTESPRAVRKRKGKNSRFENDVYDSTKKKKLGGSCPAPNKPVNESLHRESTRNSSTNDSCYVIEESHSNGNDVTRNQSPINDDGLKEAVMSSVDDAPKAQILTGNNKTPEDVVEDDFEDGTCCSDITEKKNVTVARVTNHSKTPQVENQSMNVEPRRDYIDIPDMMVVSDVKNKVHEFNPESSNKTKTNPQSELSVYLQVLPDSLIPDSESGDDILQKSPGNDVESGAYTSAETQPFSDEPAVAFSSKAPISSSSVVTEEQKPAFSPSASNKSVFISSIASTVCGSPSNADPIAFSPSTRPQRKCGGRNSRFQSDVYDLSKEKKSVHGSSLHSKKPSKGSRLKKASRKLKSNNIAAVEERSGNSRLSTAKTPDKELQPFTSEESNSNNNPPFAGKKPAKGSRSSIKNEIPNRAVTRQSRRTSRRVTADKSDQSVSDQLGRVLNGIRTRSSGSASECKRANKTLNVANKDSRDNAACIGEEVTSQTEVRKSKRLKTKEASKCKKSPVPNPTPPNPGSKRSRRAKDSTVIGEQDKENETPMILTSSEDSLLSKTSTIKMTPKSADTASANITQMVKRAGREYKRRKVTSDNGGLETIEKNEGDKPDGSLLLSAALSLRPRREKPRVMFTGVIDKVGESIVKELGGHLTEDMLECTHLVTDKMRRTVKFLCAVVRGIFIVNQDWLRVSKQHRRFLDEDEFELSDDKLSQSSSSSISSSSDNFHLESMYDFSLSESLCTARNRTRGLFESYRIHVTKSVLPPPEQMYQIIKCGGGRGVAKLPRGGNLENVVVVSSEQDERFCSSALKAGIPVFNKEFVLTGILQQRLNFKKYRLFEKQYRSQNMNPETLNQKLNSSTPIKTRSAKDTNRRLTRGSNPQSTICTRKRKTIR